MSRFDVIGFGALNLDKLFKVNKLARAEEESFIEDYSETCGGSAANTAVGLARLGCKVGYIGKVGCDREGDVLIKDFCNEGVNIDGVVRAEQGKSGVVMGFVDKKGARALYVDPGVNDTVNIDEVNARYAAQAQFLHLTSFVGEESLQTQKKLLDAVPDSTKVSFDPGALYARKGYLPLEPIIRKTHVLMPNILELTILTGEISYHKGADIMIEKGVKIVVVKLGGDGCYITDGHEQHLIKPFKVDVVDTTGAGDAFCAGFLYGLVNDKSLLDCGKLGNFVASRCIVKMGARAGLPATEDLELLG